MLLQRKLANYTIHANWNSLSFEFFSMFEKVKKSTQTIFLPNHTFYKIKHPRSCRASCFCCRQCILKQIENRRYWGRFQGIGNWKILKVARSTRLCNILVRIHLHFSLAILTMVICTFFCKVF